MARRKRLDPAPQAAPAAAPAIPGPFAAPAGRPAPISTVAGDSAAAAALDELADTLRTARAEGRLVLDLPLDAVDEHHLVRDRIAADPEAMEELVASIRARGQQAPIDVADLGGGRYGLISGWRRLVALRQLQAEGAGTGSVLALVRNPRAAAGAYLAMIEENEIRAGLSFYERARVVVRATDAGVFADDREALAHLFAAASRPRRSKIGSFVRVVRALDGVLRFPRALSERQGLRLAAGLDAQDGLEQRLIAALSAAPPATAAAEWAVIAACLRPAPAASLPPALPPAPPAVAPQPVSAPLRLHEEGPERLVIEGTRLADPDFRARLLAWLRAENSL